MTTRDNSMDRREAIRRVGFLLGGLTLVGGARLLEAEDPHARAARIVETGNGVGEFTAADIAFLDEVADTILPPTKSPGAKAAQTGAFMALMVTDIYAPRDQDIFREGMRAIDDACRKANGMGFMPATSQQRLALLEQLDREQKAHMDAVATAWEENAAPRAHYFRMMKELALLGYFTSEIGCTQAQHYVETPARYDPCLPYTKGETSWAAHA